ncbi:MAG: hypothetical protein KF752_17255 [Pirellulaceae bacterium]|nr:hypothetical protein [Pirellulaceae bacterium]
MTTIDQYQACVCGSGKKIKFCKCGAADQLPELERIIRLIDGQQDLAAVDRINSLLTKLPNAAWLLAVKGELALSMQEMPMLVETAQRFIKLKPDNPLALIYCSMAAGIQEEPIQQQARYLLDGLAEAREAMPRPASYAIQMLVQRLLMSEDSALLGFWGELQELVSRQVGLQSVSMDPSIHLICKSQNRLVHTKEFSQWTERLDEVNALVSIFRYEQAEKKLNAILRDFPNQPGPLSHLLRAQVAQLNRPGAIATAKKLAEHPSVSLDDRLYFRVLAWEFERKPLLARSFVRFGEIQSEDKVIEALIDLEESRLDELDDSRHFMAAMIGDEVPARRVFQMFQPRSDADGDLRTFAGIVAVFGKQTDKPARALLLAADVPTHRPLLEKIESLLQITRAADQQPEYAHSYDELLARNAYMHGSERPWVTLEARGRMLVDDFLNMPQQVLGDLSPLEAATRPEHRESLQALLLHLEGCQAILAPSSAIQEIYQRLAIERPARLPLPESGQPMVLPSIIDLVRIDCAGVSDNALLGITQTAASKGAHRLELELAKQILARDTLSQNPSAQLMARTLMMEFDPDLEAKIEHSKIAESLLVQANRPVGQLILRRMNLLARLGREQAAQECMMEAVRKYPRDPELAAFLEQIQTLSAARRQSPMGPDDLALSTGAAPAGQQASSLVLPGAAPAQQQESKLWLPGS